MRSGHSRGSVPDPGSPEAIRAHVDETREQLGDTVEQLAAKTDLKQRARDRSAAVDSHLRTTAARAARVLNGRAAEAAHRLQERTPEVVRMVRQNAPNKIRETTTRAMRAGDTRLGQGVMAMGAVVVAFLVLRHQHRRRAPWSAVRPRRLRR
jgi:Protein of unknown function (DUF3618)